MLFWFGLLEIWKVYVFWFIVLMLVVENVFILSVLVGGLIGVFNVVCLFMFNCFLFVYLIMSLISYF